VPCCTDGAWATPNAGPPMMDTHVQASSVLTPDDQELLRKVKAGLPLTADVSRADVLLCTPSGHNQALAVFHAIPNSISSLYRKDATGRVFTLDEHPLLIQALRKGAGGRRQREVLSNGAPIIQDVFPIYGTQGTVIGAMLVETNMIAHERQRRRSRRFRQAVVWMQEMCARGELESASGLDGFTLYDGIYLVDQNRSIIYMSGIAANLFRTAGINPEVHEQPLATLEEQDIELVEQVFATQQCHEVRHETEDGRIWMRIAIPLRQPQLRWRRPWLAPPWTWPLGGNVNTGLSAVLVLLHNATEAVQKQRELNVKSAIIQEVHHRVKNNLQNIAAILRIQARRVSSDEARQHINDAVNRVLSMSVIHEFLSQDEHRPISVKDVIQRIATQVTQVSVPPDQDIAIQVMGSNVRLPASQATPVAMVLNELLLNAVEHGLQGRSRGRITITLDDLGDAVRITVEDDGTGLPPDFDPMHHSSSLGLHIVHTLVTDDLKGSLHLESRADSTPAEGAEAEQTGTRVIVTFPKRFMRIG
jgi:two-component system, sensor histidine kinase PdtaS